MSVQLFRLGNWRRTTGPVPKGVPQPGDKRKVWGTTISQLGEAYAVAEDGVAHVSFFWFNQGRMGLDPSQPKITVASFEALVTALAGVEEVAA